VIVGDPEAGGRDAVAKRTGGRTSCHARFAGQYDRSTLAECLKQGLDDGELGRRQPQIIVGNWCRRTPYRRRDYVAAEIALTHMVARQIWPVPQLCAARRATAHFRRNCHQTVQRAARLIEALASQSVHPASAEVSI